MRWIVCLLLVGCSLSFSPGEDDRIMVTREWVLENVEYVADEEDEWQTPEETYRLRTGDCEDFALLIASGMEGSFVCVYEKIKYPKEILNCTGREYMHEGAHALVRVGNVWYDSTSHHTWYGEEPGTLLWERSYEEAVEYAQGG